jgi:hypothetical protein
MQSSARGNRLAWVNHSVIPAKAGIQRLAKTIAMLESDKNGSRSPDDHLTKP